MNSLGKIAVFCFLFLIAFFFIPLLCAQTLPDTESGGEDQPAVAAEPAVDNVDDDDFYGDDFFFEADDLIFEAPPIETRTFDAVFPNYSRTQKVRIMNGVGIRNSYESGGSTMFIPNHDSGIDLVSRVMEKKPSHIVEALVVVPYRKRELDMLDIYNALGRVKNIKDHKIYLNDREIIIFKDTTRLKSAKERKPIPDPAPTNILPFSETMYLLFLDPYIGDLYLRGDMTVSLYGITYSMTNFRAVSYSIFKVMKEERFIAVIYLEPLKEGLLIYAVSGLYLPNFIAKRINLTPNMNRRITVLLEWIIDGLRVQEESRQEKHFYMLKPKQ